MGSKGVIINQRRHFASSENAPSIDYVSKLREFYTLDEKNSMIVPVFKKALLYGNNVAVRDYNGEYSYFQVFSNSKRLSRQIANLCGSGSLSTVAILYTNNLLSTITMWASWMCGQVVMPIDSNIHFQEQLKLLQSGHTRLIIATAINGQLANKLAYELDVPVLILDPLFIQKATDPFNYRREVFIGSKSIVIEGMLANDFYSSRDALLLPTINVHGQEKIVMLSHRNLCHQLQSLAEVLQLCPEDRLLNVLSSARQVRGYLSTALTPFSVGSTLHTFDEPFDAPRCWSTILGINAQQRERPNILLAEPEVLHSLITEYDKIFQQDNRMADFIRNYCQKNFRLMVSNCGPLSKVLVQRWHQITGHHLINMFYMPETGMIFHDDSDSTTSSVQQQMSMMAEKEKEEEEKEAAASSINSTDNVDENANSTPTKRSNSGEDVNPLLINPLGIWNSFRQTMPDVRIRLLDANNNIVLEKNDSQIEILNEENEESTVLFESEKSQKTKEEEEALQQKEVPRRHLEKAPSTVVIGNLLVSGPSLFRCYLRETPPPEEGEYFFNTGLLVAYENGSFKILGRSKCLNTSTIESLDNSSSLESQPKHIFPELSERFCLHPAIDYIHLKEGGVICGIKSDRQLSLDHLKYFRAFIQRDADNAMLFHLIKVKDNE